MREGSVFLLYFLNGRSRVDGTIPKMTSDGSTTFWGLCHLLSIRLSVAWSIVLSGKMDMMYVLLSDEPGIPT